MYRILLKILRMSPWNIPRKATLFSEVSIHDRTQRFSHNSTMETHKLINSCICIANTINVAYEPWVNYDRQAVLYISRYNDNT